MKKEKNFEHLNLRIDPKVAFAVEFASKVKGQSKLTLVERAVRKEVDTTTLLEGGGNTWRDYWDPSEPVRSLKLLCDSEYRERYASEDEEKTYDFTRKHWPFFYLNESARHPRKAFVEIFWPRLNELMDLDRKSDVYWAAGFVMQEALKKAGLAVPEWPPKAPEPKSKPKTDVPDYGKPPMSDDDIPF